MVPDICKRFARWDQARSLAFGISGVPILSGMVSRVRAAVKSRGL
jgi:hypothetical protein